MNDRDHRLSTQWELDLDYVPSARFATLLVERALSHVASSSS